MERKRVLLAEDHAAARTMMREVLATAGWKVEAYATGEQLLTALTYCFDQLGSPPDVVVTDVRLPGCTGLEVVTRLRRYDPVTRVVVVTAFPDGEVERRAWALGAQLLPKPFEPEDLMRAAAGQ
jgi:CheY-like chemotaxis protein